MASGLMRVEVTGQSRFELGVHVIGREQVPDRCGGFSIEGRRLGSQPRDDALGKLEPVLCRWHELRQFGGQSVGAVRPGDDGPQAAQRLDRLDLETRARDRWIHHDARPQVHRIQIVHVPQHVDILQVIGHGRPDTPCHDQSDIGNGAPDFRPGELQKIAQPEQVSRVVGSHTEDDRLRRPVAVLDHVEVHSGRHHLVTGCQSAKYLRLLRLDGDKDLCACEPLRFVLGWHLPARRRRRRRLSRDRSKRHRSYRQRSARQGRAAEGHASSTRIRPARRKAGATTAVEQASR